MAWHESSHYELGSVHRSDLSRDISCTSGVKQGCVIAPSLWTLFTCYVGAKFSEHRDAAWIAAHLTLFADDFHFKWQLDSQKDCRRVLEDLRLIFEVLQDHGLTINPAKSSFLVEVRGPEGDAWLRKHRMRDAEGNWQFVWDLLRRLKVPIVRSFRYLGVMLSYHAFEDETMHFRLQPAQQHRNRLSRTLQGRGGLRLEQRRRIWLVCVQTSQLYGLGAVGVTEAGYNLLHIQTVKHIRAFAKSSRHLTQESDRSLLARLGLCAPLQTLMQQVDGLCHRLEQPDSSTLPCFDTAGLLGWFQGIRCFMAQYQFQHELPSHQLESKGILGFVLRHQGILRFFSGAEVAALHGAVRPILLQENRRSQMRLLGNSLAVPQAAAGLAYACHALGCKGTPEPAKAVAGCLSARVHNANAFFLPRGADWILCRKDQVTEVLASSAIRPLPPPGRTAPIDFVPLTFQNGNAEVTLYAPTGAQALRVFAHLGVAHIAPMLPAAAHDRLHALRLSVDSLPGLDGSGFQGGSANREGLCTVLVYGGVFVIDTWSPRMWTQLLNVFDFLTSEAEDLCCWNPSGQKLRFADDFEGCVIAGTSPAEAPELPLSLLAQCVPHLQVTFQDHTARLQCPPASAT
ncbi:unnamed protein product [Symbiodinium sp. CCMP2592]|nr:unnamed protein product [Symbiodinium sp. CCMP2592]